jgi:GR25 family glycosyltransferase involved in LPS biosynthesis
MRLFDKFDKVYCINLDRRPDRLENFKKEVNKFNLGEFERFSAYDGKQLNLTNEYNLKPGEIGIIKSNLDIIKDAKKNNYKTILIIEDDCVFRDEIINFEDYFKLLPSDWDMLYMGGNHNTHMGVKPPLKINDKVVKLHSTYSAHFIGIKSSVFDQIEELLEKGQQPLDVEYVTLQKIFNCYSFTPALTSQLVNFSDIQELTTDYNWLIK